MRSRSAGDYVDSAHLLKERYGDLPVSLRFPLPDDPADDGQVREGARDPAVLT